MINCTEKNTSSRKRSIANALLTVGLTTTTIFSISPTNAMPMQHHSSGRQMNLIDHAIFQIPAPLSGPSLHSKSGSHNHYGNKNNNDIFGVKEVLTDVLKRDEYEAKEEAWHVLLEPTLEIGKSIGKSLAA
jgi:hypothetical protein